MSLQVSPKLTKNPVAPNFPIGTPTSKIPLRWLYRVDEKNENTANVNAAITSQYGGKDEVTAVMWLLK
jgi:hypothetical protein